MILEGAVQKQKKQATHAQITTLAVDVDSRCPNPIIVAGDSLG